MSIQERIDSVNRGLYAEHHGKVIRRSMENLLAHCLGLNPEEIQRLSDLDLAQRYIKTLTVSAETTRTPTNGADLQTKVVVATNIAAEAASTAAGSEHHVNAISHLTDLLADNPQALAQLRGLQNNR